jgi:hypothetical protein
VIVRHKYKQRVVDLLTYVRDASSVERFLGGADLGGCRALC